jgi:hypothetical protein
MAEKPTRTRGELVPLRQIIEQTSPNPPAQPADPAGDLRLMLERLYPDRTVKMSATEAAGFVTALMALFPSAASMMSPQALAAYTFVVQELEPEEARLALRNYMRWPTEWMPTAAKFCDMGRQIFMIEVEKRATAEAQRKTEEFFAAEIERARRDSDHLDYKRVAGTLDDIASQAGYQARDGIRSHAETRLKAEPDLIRLFNPGTLPDALLARELVTIEEALERRSPVDAGSTNRERWRYVRRNAGSKDKQFDELMAAFVELHKADPPATPGVWGRRFDEYVREVGLAPWKAKWEELCAAGDAKVKAEKEASAAPSPTNKKPETSSN